MNEIRIWATDFALILIFTGIFMKFISPQSERNTIRFVVTLILILSLLRINTGMFGNVFDFQTKNEISENTDYLNKKIEKILSDMTAENISKEIENIVSEYDNTAIVKSDISENKLNVVISSNNLTNKAANEIKNLLNDRFDCEISILTEKG